MPTILEVYREHRVPYETRRDDWVNTRCPHCGGGRLKLGYHLPHGPHWCWQCGFHPVAETLEMLLGVSAREARDIARELPRDGPGDRGLRRDREAQKGIQAALADRYRRPPDVGPLRTRHRRYLEGRGFDPDELEREWGVCSTGPTSYLDGVSYAHRVFVPIAWNRAEVSFQARAVGDGAGRAKYLSCQPGRENVPHKQILYGRQEAWGGRTGIAVEGVTDAWRLGPLAFATFGVAFSRGQVEQVARHFDRVAIVFDGEREAQKRARRLADAICGWVRYKVLAPGNASDPGSMVPDDARALVREVERWGR